MKSPNASIASSASIHDSAMVWDFAQIREGVLIDANVIVGAGAYIGSGVHIGANSKIQNSALIYEPAVIGEGVFIGPGAILTNDRNPRAVNVDGTRKSASDWSLVGVKVERGASIGAGAICVAPIRIGNWAMIAAGCIVVKDVPDFALVVGNPGRQIGWVGRSGSRLIPADAHEIFVCPITGDLYQLVEGKLGLL